MNLPKLPAREPCARGETVAFLGLNFSDDLRPGELTDCANLTAERYPRLAVRRPRRRVEGYGSPTALTAWGRLLAVDGTDLLCGGEKVGEVSPGAKQFAVVNTKLIIWPDKLCLDMDSLTLAPLGARCAAAGAVFTADGVTLTAPEADLTALFREGDGLELSGCTVLPQNNRAFVVKTVTADTLTAVGGGFTAGTEPGAVAVERRVPDLDFICESGNRLWGCSGAERTIYASALGDPSNFFVYQGLSTDSYAVGAGSEGAFTGCCALASSVLFWKENCLHKILGGSPSEYSMATYSMDGLQPGCAKSLQVINEVLFYMGAHGVYAYSGGTPVLLSRGFARRGFTDGVAGTDGSRYYLSVREGTRSHLFVYDTRRSLWLREDGVRAVDFARLGRDVYLLDDGGALWKLDAGAGGGAASTGAGAADLETGAAEEGSTGGEEETVDWFAELAPFYETAQGRKTCSRLLLRVELGRRAWLRAEVRCDGGPWLHAGYVRGGTADTVTLPVVPLRCDKFQVRLSGRGACAVLSMVREVRVGSDK